MVDRLRRFIEESTIEAKIHEMDGKTKSAKQAAKELGTTTDHIIKSLVFIVDGEPVLVIVPGSVRADTDKLEEVMEADDVDMASPEEVKEATEYRIGGVPPVSLDLKKVIHEDVLEKEKVYGGGGSKQHIIEIDPRFLVDEDSVVAPVTE